MTEEILVVGGVRDRHTIVDLNAYWRDTRFYYSSGNLEYICCHFNKNMATSDNEWEIWKYTIGADGISRRQGPETGSIDNRASLDWG